MCNYVFTRGTNSGKQCQTKPRGGANFCAKHKKYEIQEVKIDDVHEIDDNNNNEGKCEYIYTKGKNLGHRCQTRPRNGHFCSKHKPKNQPVPQIVISDEVKVEDIKVDDIKCEVCYEDKSPDEFVRSCSVDACNQNHKLCKGCLEHLQNPRCPFCRSNLSNEALEIYNRTHPVIPQPFTRGIVEGDIFDLLNTIVREMDRLRAERDRWFNTAQQLINNAQRQIEDVGREIGGYRLRERAPRVGGSRRRIEQRLHEMQRRQR